MRLNTNMQNKDVIIIKYLIEHKNEELSIRNISFALKIDYKNVHSMVKRLEHNSLVKLESFGPSKRVKLIQKIHPLIFEAEYLRREEILKDKNMSVMLNEFKKVINTKYFILLLFGSYAKKTQTKSSDIDLMFIVPERQEEICEKSIISQARLLPLPLHCLVFSENQFLEMLNSQKLNVGKEALKNNIVLYGVESYYEMFQIG